MLLAFLRYDPLVRIEIGPLAISPHGIGIAAGFLIGARVMMRNAAKRGMTEEQVYPLVVRAAIGSMIGARIAYVLNHPSAYLDDPVQVLRIWEGGISLLGGIAGAILVGLPKIRSQGLSLWRVLDAAVPGIALGIALGRFGDLVIADHLGKSTDFFLGYVCPQAGVDVGSTCVAGAGNAVHQPALYDIFSAAPLAFLLFRLERGRRYDGFLALVFGAWYGTGRFVEDFFRIDVTHGTGLTGSQWTSVVVVTLCLWSLFVRRRTPWASGKGAHASPARPAPPANGVEPGVEVAPRPVEPDG